MLALPRGWSLPTAALSAARSSAGANGASTVTMSSNEISARRSSSLRLSISVPRPTLTFSSRPSEDIEPE